MEAISRRPNSVRTMLEMLDDLPVGVDELYAEAMSRIMAQSELDARVARRVFSWLIHAKSSLSVQDIQLALTFDIDKQLFDLENEVAIDLILSACGGLIEIYDDQQPIPKRRIPTGRGSQEFRFIRE